MKIEHQKSENLWPSIPFNDSSLPKQILEEQAEFLPMSSVGLLLGEVISRERENKEIEVNISAIEKGNASLMDTNIMHSLYISVPCLNGYRFELLRIIQKKLTGYPLKLQDLINDVNYDIQDDEDLISHLEQIFNNSKVVDFLGLLMAQAR